MSKEILKTEATKLLSSEMHLLRGGDDGGSTPIPGGCRECKEECKVCRDGGQ